MLCPGSIVVLFTIMKLPRESYKQQSTIIPRYHKKMRHELMHQQKNMTCKSQRKPAQERPVSSRATGWGDTIPEYDSSNFLYQDNSIL